MAKTKNSVQADVARGLTLNQESAVDLLVIGKTDAEVAEALGVHRVTVTR